MITPTSFNLLKTKYLKSGLLNGKYSYKIYLKRGNQKEINIEIIAYLNEFQNQIRPITHSLLKNII